MDGERDDALSALARAHGADPDELRREVSRFRLALDTDLTLAAAAVDEGEASMAADVLAADAAALPGFEHGLRSRVADVARSRRLTARRRVVAVAVAAGLVGVAGGAAVAATALRHPGQSPSVTAPSARGFSAAQTLAVSQADTLTYAAAHRLPTPTILAASGALQTTLLPLLAQAPRDRALASQLHSLLTSQRTALSSVAVPDAQVDAAIRSTESLLAQLAAGVTAAVPTPATVPPGGAPSASAPSLPTGPAGTHPASGPSLTMPAPSSAGLAGQG